MSRAAKISRRTLTERAPYKAAALRDNVDNDPQMRLRLTETMRMIINPC